MFSDLDRDDVFKLIRIFGIVFFVLSFFLPAVTTGYAVSPADYFIASDAYHGWACAAWTLYGTVMFIGSLIGHDRQDGSAFFFMVSGWITPLVIVFGVFLGSIRAKRRAAKALTFLLIARGCFLRFPSPAGAQAHFVH